MKRVFLTAMLLASLLFNPGLLNPSKADAANRPLPKLVQVSDRNFEDFYQLFLLDNQARGNHLKIENITDEPYPGEAYDTYILMASRKGIPGKHAAVICLYTNKAGPVSKITITAPMDNNEAKLDAYVSEYVLLGTLGIEDTRSKAFMRDILARQIPFQIALWDYETGRNIAVHHEPSPTTDTLYYIKITAYDQLFPKERR